MLDIAVILAYSIFYELTNSASYYWQSFIFKILIIGHPRLALFGRAQHGPD